MEQNEKERKSLENESDEFELEKGLLKSRLKQCKIQRSSFVLRSGEEYSSLIPRAYHSWHTGEPIKRERERSDSAADYLIAAQAIRKF